MQRAPGAPARIAAAAPGDARAGNPALVYEASVTLAVDKVRDAASQVVRLLGELEGQLLVQDEGTVVFRVPKARLDDALGGVERLGDVLGRQVRAEDVSDRYRDLEIRLRNARAVRDRLEVLLGRSASIQDSLKIEAELSRVTEEIERLSGQLAQLTHQVAFSKVTVHLQPRQVTITEDPTFRLPFPWLDTLTLGRLLDLREES
jgi:hypothetical protein